MDGNGEIVPRSEYEYPVDVKAEAIAIVWATGNCSDAYRELKERYPERYPGRDLIWRWAKSIDPERFSELQQERKETVQNRAVDLALLTVDLLEDELTAGNVKGQPLAITTGIVMDKVLKLLEIEKRGGFSGAQTVIVNFIEAKRPPDRESPDDVIEGEVVKDDERV